MITISLKKVVLFFVLMSCTALMGQELRSDTIEYSEQLKPLMDKTLQIFALIREYPKSEKQLRNEMTWKSKNDSNFFDSMCRAKHLLNESEEVDLMNFRYTSSTGYYPDEKYIFFHYQPHDYQSGNAEIIIQFSKRSDGFQVLNVRGTESIDSEWFDNLIDSLDNWKGSVSD